MDYRVFTDIFADPSRANDLAVIYGEERYTFRELREAAELCAGDLAARGVKPGEHVALWAYNSVDWLIALLGVVRLGAVAVLANYSMPRKHLAPILCGANVRYLCWGLNHDSHRDAAAGSELARELGIPGRDYDLQRADFKKRVRAGERPVPMPDEVRDAERTAVIIYTSGTTSKPKAVMLSQQSILHNACAARAQIIDYVLPLQNVCIGLPLFHSYGLTVSLAFLLTGKCLCLVSRLDPEELIETVSRSRAGIVVSVGILFLGMISSLRFKTEVAPHVRLCIVGGEFASAAQILRMDHAYPNVRFIVGYGQTEAGPIISLNHPLDRIERRAYTVGKALPNTLLRITGANNETLASGKIGEVCVKSDSVMNGYYALPKERQPFDAEGWLHTGDLGFLDEEGYLCLTGRIKDIIIKNGENISPAEIETELRKCDGVRDVCVLGAPDAVCGEEIEACLTMMEGYRFDENAIRTQLLQYLTKFKMPAHYFVYDTFPMNANGKINVAELKKTMLSRLESRRREDAFSENE